MSGKHKLFRFFMSFVLVLSTLAAGVLPVSMADTAFTDVSDTAYYAEAVSWTVEQGITKGTSDTAFSPDDGCTRGQCVTFLYRYAGSPEVDAALDSNFTDVKLGAYYADAVAWAVDNGVTTGTSKTTFSPDENCSRAQIVTFLWRYNGKPAAKDAGAFTDVKSDAYYAGAVSWAVAQNITKGTSDTTFSPDQTCTRAQIVTFLYRMDRGAEQDNPGEDPDPSGGDSDEPGDQDPQSGTVDLDKANVGDYVTFGHYEQDNDMENGREAIEWKVLDKKDGRVLLLSKYGLDTRKYNEGYSDVTWENCTMRSWLNGDFLDTAFSSSEKSAIPTVTLMNSDNPNFETKGGSSTNDRVFLLSLEEMRQYFALFDTWTDYNEKHHDVTGNNWFIGGSKDVITSPTAYAEAQGVWASSTLDAEGNGSCWWWLRSPGYTGTCATHVDYSGGVNAYGGNAFSVGGVVRPAIWVNLAS